jgi:hypothetical protein
MDKLAQGNRFPSKYIAAGGVKIPFFGGFSIDREKRFWDKFLEQGFVESMQKGKTEGYVIDFVGRFQFPNDIQG